MTEQGGLQRFVMKVIETVQPDPRSIEKQIDDLRAAHPSLDKDGRTMPASTPSTDFAISRNMGASVPGNG
jgi:hypothetical protein